MCIFDAPPGVLDQVQHLSNEEKADFSLVFKDIFDSHKLRELKEYLLFALSVCLSTDNDPIDDPFERSGAMLSTYPIIRCLEAARDIAGKLSSTFGKPSTEAPLRPFKDIAATVRQEFDRMNNCNLKRLE